VRILAVFLNTGLEDRDQIRKKYFLICCEKPQATITLNIWFRLRLSLLSFSFFFLFLTTFKALFDLFARKES